MPVIRGSTKIKPLTPQRRAALVARLTAERQQPTQDGPVLFEIPLEQSDRFDVMVVWQEWESVTSEDRSAIIREVYQGDQNVAQALGVTYQEAMEQQLLPYAVVPMARPDEIDPEKVREAMIQEGGIHLERDRVDLRFPTMAMAEASHQRLVQRLPRGYWSIVQTVGTIP
jgi:hypothetical protein